MVNWINSSFSVFLFYNPETEQFDEVYVNPTNCKGLPSFSHGINLLEPVLQQLHISGARGMGTSILHTCAMDGPLGLRWDGQPRCKHHSATPSNIPANGDRLWFAVGYNAVSVSNKTVCGLLQQWDGDLETGKTVTECIKSIVFLLVGALYA